MDRRSTNGGSTCIQLRLGNPAIRGASWTGRFAVQLDSTCYLARLPASPAPKLDQALSLEFLVGPAKFESSWTGKVESELDWRNRVQPRFNYGGPTKVRQFGASAWLDASWTLVGRTTVQLGSPLAEVQPGSTTTQLGPQGNPSQQGRRRSARARPRRAGERGNSQASSGATRDRPLQRRHSFATTAMSG